AVESTMDRITTQQRCTLVNILIALLTHHDGTQTNPTVGSLARDQDASEQASDATKAVENNIARLFFGSCANNFLTLLLQVCTQIIRFGGAETFSHSTHINRCSPKAHIYQFTQDR